MSTPIPRILVIDDILGRVISGRQNSDRRRFCRKYKLNDVTVGDERDSAEATTVGNPIAEAVFCRGQNPTSSPPGSTVKNDIERSLRTIHDGWDRESVEVCWSLVLLDMCFYTGNVPTGSSSEMPDGRADDRDPKKYFGLQILDGIDKDESLKDLPIVILSSMARDEIEERFADRAIAFIETDENKDLKSDEQLRLHLNDFGLITYDSPIESEHHIVGTSRPLRVALQRARIKASSGDDILVRGEQGTGKESLARYIHRQSSGRGGRPFVAVDCGTASVELWKSELFGHRRGAFTGADRERVGRIVEAEGGDVFLDEIGNMPFEVQRMLLRVLDTRRVTPVGGDESDARTVNVRFISATNADLEQMVKEGTFKDDLLARLRPGGVAALVSLPPLRERRSDIKSLVNHFVSEYKRNLNRLGKPSRDWCFANDALNKLIGHTWPENIRELKGCVTAALALARELNVITARRIEFTPVHEPDEKPATTFTVDRRLRFLDYRIQDEIARGGMGVVSRALDTRLGRIVALKQIRHDKLGDTNSKRFEVEATTMASFQHPNIVRVFDFGEDDQGGFYFAMEYISGGNLAQQLKQCDDERMPNREAARLLLTIAQAVQYAHDQGVIHRDLKPGNVLLDGEKRPLVTDFGVCKRLGIDAQLTGVGDGIGTLSYMPPEQLPGSSEDVTIASDVYSLGAILYRLLTGRPPFGDDDTPAARIVTVLQQIADESPTPPSHLTPTIDRRLETICLKCLEKDQADRFPTVDTLAAELRNYLRTTLSTSDVINYLSQQRIAGFSEAIPAINFVELTASAASLVFGYLDSEIRRVERRTIGDVYEHFTGNREKSHNKCCNFFSFIFTFSPEQTLRAVPYFERLMWLAGVVAKRNKQISGILGGVCYLRMIPRMEREQFDEDRLLELLKTEGEAENETEIDVDYAWRGINELLVQSGNDDEPFSYLVKGGREIATVKSEFVGAPRMLASDQVRAFAESLSSLALDDLGQRTIAENLAFCQLDEETQRYYLGYLEDLRIFAQRASDEGCPVVVYFR